VPLLIGNQFLIIDLRTDYSNTDDSGQPLDSRLGTKCVAAASMLASSPAKFPAIVYHGIFLLINGETRRA
jgi:hypothetical protein